MGSIPVATTTPVNKKAPHRSCGAFLFTGLSIIMLSAFWQFPLNKNHPTKPGDFCLYMKRFRELTAYCFVSTIVYDVGVG